MRRAVGLVGGGLAAGVVAMGVVVPAQAQVATDGVPFTQLQAQVNELTVALQTERTEREADTAALEAALNQEIANRTEGDTALSSALASEEQARQAADAAHDTWITALERRRLYTDTYHAVKHVNKASSATLFVGCPLGRQIVGGGWRANEDESTTGRWMVSSGPKGNQWMVELNNDLLSDWNGTVYAICANFS